MKLTAEQLQTLADAERLVRTLQDTNSSYPATQEFLEARGLTNVRQLDRAGRAALVAHLQATLRKLQN